MNKATSVSPGERRRFIKLLAASTVAGTVSSLLPGQIAWAIDAGQQPAGADFPAFMSVSEIICGYPTLDNALGKRIYTLITAEHSDASQSIAALQKQLNANMSSAEMQTALKKLNTPTQQLFSKILRGWQIGIVGSGKQSRVVAYEYALMYAPISDVVVLPTFARGEPHYWAFPPVFKTGKL